jgi:hypothetical protein
MSPRRSTLTILAAAVAVLGSILTLWQQPGDVDCRPVGGAPQAACEEIVSGPEAGIPQDGVLPPAVADEQDVAEG